MRHAFPIRANVQISERALATLVSFVSQFDHRRRRRRRRRRRWRVSRTCRLHNDDCGSDASMSDMK